jgi:hypothetical protein
MACLIAFFLCDLGGLARDIGNGDREVVCSVALISESAQARGGADARDGCFSFALRRTDFSATESRT